MINAAAVRRVISLFTGAGGMDYGFEAAGFETAVALEVDHDCCETLHRNRNWQVIPESISDVRTEELLAAGKFKRGTVDLLIGGPPCQPFSKSGYWARGDSARLGDPRAGTLTDYLRVVDETLPKVFVLENVSGLAYSGKDEGLQLVLDHVRRTNERHRTRYDPKWKVLSAADFGVPQIRERFFLVAAKDGLEFQFPTPSATKPRTAWDALGDLPEPQEVEALAPRGKWANLLSSIPEGQNYLWHTERRAGLPLFGWRRKYWSFLLKLAKNRPSWTIQAQPGPAVGPFHWKNRQLSPRELARLQTIPDSVHIEGNDGSVRKQLGNAVPSLLAEVVGREILRQCFGERPSGTIPKLLPPDRGTAPPPEPVQPVPAFYQKFIGRHLPHPGTGKGPRAKAGYQRKRRTIARR